LPPAKAAGACGRDGGLEAVHHNGRASRSDRSRADMQRPCCVDLGGEVSSSSSRRSITRDHRRDIWNSISACGKNDARRAGFERDATRCHTCAVRTLQDEEETIVDRHAKTGQRQA